MCVVLHQVMMMMLRSIGKRKLWTFLWTAFLHFMFTSAGHVENVPASSVLRRHKREWQWNTMLVYEERQPQNPPQAIGKVATFPSDSHSFRKTSRFNVFPRDQFIVMKMHPFHFLCKPFVPFCLLAEEHILQGEHRVQALRTWCRRHLQAEQVRRCAGAEEGGSGEHQ